jgi:hypothetical protein
MSKIERQNSLLQGKSPVGFLGTPGAYVWIGSLNKGVYETPHERGTANEYDHIELSGVPKFAQRS